ncbi:hypothetical protein PROFUN_14415 [Planoprotostelium fungivorum]|uniref:Uncharacterized protein n=1 Tax=Planoprotostelium fungivorum TaxID=1890364 RepID=A0A2P6MX69_9EUKA|nr:hypothetical protein PROFUN_14415 [Planoprotostelium fungivorum]
MCTKHAQNRYKEKHRAHNNACFTFQTNRNTTHKAHPQTLISLCLLCSDFYLVCKHTKAYKCFAENLQTDHRKQAFSVCLVVGKCTMMQALRDIIRSLPLFCVNLICICVRVKALSVTEDNLPEY